MGGPAPGGMPQEDPQNMNSTALGVQDPNMMDGNNNPAPGGGEEDFEERLRRLKDM
jgi:hypothetical protein